MIRNCEDCPVVAVASAHVDDFSRMGNKDRYQLTGKRSWPAEKIRAAHIPLMTPSYSIRASSGWFSVRRLYGSTQWDDSLLSRLDIGNVRVVSSQRYTQVVYPIRLPKWYVASKLKAGWDTFMHGMDPRKLMAALNAGVLIPIAAL